MPQQELLQNSAQFTASSADRKTLKRERGAAIRRWVVCVRNGARYQVATHARIVRLKSSVVSSADKGTGECMAKPRCRGPGALIKVTRVLMEQRRQNRPADHDVRHAIGIGRSKTLAVSFPSLLKVWRVACLIERSKNAGAKDAHRIDRNLVRQLKLELGRERRRVFGIVDHIKIGHKPEEPLFLLDLHLLGCDLEWIGPHCH